MSDIFISYARKDKPQVELLASAIEKKGWSVWWDPKIRSGQSFDRVIETALNDAKCVIVVWSRHSVDSDWVRAEAMNGLSRNILISILIDSDITLPLRFSQIQSEELVDWDGSDTSPAMEKLASDIESVIGYRHLGQDNKTTSEAEINYDRVIWKERVFELGDRVRTTSQSGTNKPTVTGHTIEVENDKGKTGIIIDFMEKGVPSYLPLESLRKIRQGFDSRAIEVAVVSWDKQDWKESKGGKIVTIDEHVSRIHVSYLEVIGKGNL